MCKRFYRLTLPIKYRTALARNNNWENERTKRLINPSSQVPLFVRSLTLDDRYMCGSDDAEILVDVVDACKNARSIHVMGSYKFSQKVLNAIEKNLPNAEIKYRADFQYEEEGLYEGWAREGPLPGGMDGFCSRQLVTLTIDSMWNCDDQGLPVEQRSLRKIIPNDPNLKHFESWSTQGHPDWRGLPQVLDLRLKMEDKLPVLESFCYIPLYINTLQTWGAVTGWSNLRVLKLAVLEPLLLLNSVGLPSLQSLTISKIGHDNQYKAEQFDKLPRIDSPVQFLSITHIGDDILPHNF